MKILAFVVVGSLLLAGCATAPTPAPKTPAASNVEPLDRAEQDLLSGSNNGDALADHAIDLVMLADSIEGNISSLSVRQRAYQFAKLARERGTTNPLVPLLLAQITPEGKKVERTFSSQADADAFVHEGEVQFGRHRFEQALQCYKEALEIDPKCSTAALFAGDVYFAQQKYEEALPWFDRAIAINPLVETAHRYRADALMKLGRFDEAGQGYIRAFVAAPQDPIPGKALSSWVARRQLKIERPDSGFIVGRVDIKDDKPAIYLDPDNINWIAVAYAGARAKYLDEHKPAPQSYRLTLAEEIEALHTVIVIAGELSQNTPDDEQLKAHRAMFDKLEQIDRDGLLEAHILLDRTSAELLKDYPAYLAAHHDLLARYVAKYWLNLP